VRSFLVFLGIIAVIGLVWAITPITDKRARGHEQRLVAALNLVEDAIVSSSTDILRVDLFSPEIASLSGDGRWKLDGVVETQGRAGKAVHVRYVAAVAFSCTPYDEPGCGEVQSLSIEGQPLVVDGATVADLQSVLDAATGVTDETLPGTSPGDTTAAPTPLPAPQIGAPQIGAAATETAPAAEVPASVAPAMEEPADPVAPAATESQPAVPAVAPPTDDEPIQGNRQIFLIQKSLREMGYDPGPVDGQVGPRTTSAIQAYQRRAGLSVDGQPSAALLDHMNHSAQ